MKGKNQAVTVYQPFAFEEDINQETEQNLLIHKKAINAYDLGQWDQAISLFKQLKQNEFCTTTIYDIYLNRLTLLKDDPPKEWDGTYTHQSK